MISILDAISSRRSVRSFTKKKVSIKIIKIILEAASKAPSGTNTQPWNVHVLTGEKLKYFTSEAKKEFIQNSKNLTLERFCVANGYKGRGISRILIKLIIDRAADLFPKEILSLSSLEETKLFYEKFGFISNYFTHDENGDIHHFMTRKAK